MSHLTLSQYLLYTSSALAVVSVVGHTQLAFELVLPSLRRAASVPSTAGTSGGGGGATTTAAAAAAAPEKTKTATGQGKGKGRDDDGLVSAGIGWMEGNQVFAILAILYAKWAKFGITDGFDRAILIFTVGYQFACGLAFARKGIYKPLAALWLGPGLATLSQLV